MRWKWLGTLIAVGWLSNVCLVRAQPDGPGAFALPPPAPEPGGGAFQTDPKDPKDIPIPADSAFIRPVSPNGFSDEECPCDKACPPIWQVGLGYSLVWFSHSHFPGPLITTGDATDNAPGALGQPHTQVLTSGNIPGTPGSALNVNVFRWLGERGRWSVDARYMLMEQRSSGAGFTSDANGNPVLAHPFFNPVAGVEDADPRSIPNIMAGDANAFFSTNFQQAEANLRWYSSPQDVTCGGLITALVGVRWIQVRERFRTADNVTDLAVGSPFANDFFISDDFSTTNEFFGGQFGLGAMWRYHWFELGLLGKVAIGWNSETVRISGLTTITNQATGGSVSDTIGLYAQRSNSGTFSGSSLTYVPELDVKASVQLWDHIKISASYDLLNMQKVVRPGDQIDRNVNIQPLLAPVQLGPALPAPPSFGRSAFILQGLTVGIEFLF